MHLTEVSEHSFTHQGWKAGAAGRGESGLAVLLKQRDYALVDIRRDGAGGVYEGDAQVGVAQELFVVWLVQVGGV